MKRHVFTFLVIILFIYPLIAFAQPLDLMPYARITASGTQPTFLLLWPRETDDAPYTVRDSIERSGWKTPRHGVQTLTVDFAPLHRHAPAVAQLDAVWERQPAGSIGVRVLDYCGGSVRNQGEWSLPTEPYHFEDPQPGFCLELIVEEADRASLTELHANAAPVEDLPVLQNLVAEEIDTHALRLHWQGDENTWLVNIHYLPSEDTELTRYNLIDTIPAGQATWEGPRPAASGMLAAVAPIAADGSQGDPLFVDAPARTIPTLDNNGVIEGFYGTPWSHVEIRKMILRLARVGLRIYMYAPKDEPLHREQWQIPYSEDQMNNFFELHSLAEQVGVDMYYAIAPGKTMILDDPDERATLLAKLTPFIEGGFRHFMIMFDDIENDISVPVDGDLGLQHADLVNWTKDALEDLADEPVKIFVNPLAKRPEHIQDWPGGEDYIVNMATTYDDVLLFWGAPTNGGTLDADSFALPLELQGRKPAFWDNQYAIDGGDAFYGRMQLAPMQRRDASMYENVQAYLTNIMFLGGADRIITASYGSFMNDPEHYNFETIPPLAAQLEATTDREQELIERLQSMFYGNNDLWLIGVSIPKNLPLEDLVPAFWDQLVTNDLANLMPVGVQMLEYAALMAVTQNDLHHSILETTLVDDVWFPCQRMNAEGFGLLHLLRWHGSAMAGVPDQAELALSNEYFWDSLLHVRYQSSPFRAWGFRFRLGGYPVPNLGFVAPPIADPPAMVKAGETWEYAAADAQVNIFGLPGATAGNGVISWTPQHPGRYYAIVTANTQQGWAWRELYLTVPADLPTGDDDDAADDDDQTDDDEGNDDDQSVDGDDDDDAGGCGC